MVSSWFLCLKNVFQSEFVLQRAGLVQWNAFARVVSQRGMFRGKALVSENVQAQQTGTIKDTDGCSFLQFAGLV